MIHLLNVNIIKDYYQNNPRLQQLPKPPPPNNNSNINQELLPKPNPELLPHPPPQLLPPPQPKFEQQLVVVQQVVGQLLQHEHELEQQLHLLFLLIFITSLYILSYKIVSEEGKLNWIYSPNIYLET